MARHSPADSDRDNLILQDGSGRYGEIDEKPAVPPWRRTFEILKAVVVCFVRILLFWELRLVDWWRRPSQEHLLHESMTRSQLFEEWEAAAYALDDLEENYIWRQELYSKLYDHRLILDRHQSLMDALDADDLSAVITIIRSGLVRNLGNITTPRLYSRAYAGTKIFIEEYVSQTALAVRYITSHPLILTETPIFSSQEKLDVLHDSRQAFGRTALVLQGGSIFGLCHIGVVKALHLRGMLPRIISGSATGALIAALVGVHREDELLEFLSSDGIDLSAFTARSREAASASSHHTLRHGWFTTLIRRARRFLEDGYLLDENALEQCVRANVGDLTFAEAYQRSKRVLNITITPSNGHVPSLLNYLTSPHVLIWSAALVSNEPDDSNLASKLFCKDENGRIVPWSTEPRDDFATTSASKFKTPRGSPLSRLSESFNVNHFIVSQARPYIAPFLRGDMSSPKPGYSGRRSVMQVLLKVFYMEIQHRLHQLDSLGYLSNGSRRFLLDEPVPGPSLTLVPDVGPRDFGKLLENPTRQALDYWILKGEKSVWPAIGALKVRMAIEIELDRGYQIARRRRPADEFTLVEPPSGNPSRRKRPRQENSTSSRETLASLGD